MSFWVHDLKLLVFSNKLDFSSAVWSKCNGTVLRASLRLSLTKLSCQLNKVSLLQKAEPVLFPTKKNKRCINPLIFLHSYKDSTDSPGFSLCFFYLFFFNWSKVKILCLTTSQVKNHALIGAHKVQTYLHKKNPSSFLLKIRIQIFDCRYLGTSLGRN